MIKVNVITGFLGSGKTTAILNLLKQKPENEKWAVLVNEFGEIGIDGALISSVSGVSVKEVPGGCMCCTSGVPMQVALNALIKEVSPDHILIEPTGLGHPKEILQVLRGKQFSSSLEVGATIALIDATKLSDERYLNHETFNQQLYVADVIVANKVDTYKVQDQARIVEFMAEKGWSKIKQLEFCRYGDLSFEWLSHPAADAQTGWVFSHLTRRSLLNTESLSVDDQSTLDGRLNADDEVGLPDTDQIRAYENYSQGYFAIGWVFPRADVFDLEKLNIVLKQLNAERVKAIVTTPNGLVGLNISGGLGNAYQLEKPPIKSNIIEIISITELATEVILKKIMGSIRHAH